MSHENQFLDLENELKNTELPIVIWGAGLMGQMANKVLSFLGKMPVCFCDINEALHGTMMDGVEVVSIKEAISRYPFSYILLCVGVMGNSYERENESAKLAKMYAHKGQVLSADIVHYIYNTKILKRSISSEKYSETILNLRHSENIMQRLSIVITDRCSLNCQDCGMLIPYKRPGKNGDIEVMVEACEKLFKLIDGVRWVQIFGGEPFLYPKLVEITKRIAAMDKALSIVLITNATLKPEQQQYDELAKYVSYFTISDYGKDLSTYSKEIGHACKKSGMVYSIENYNEEGRSWVTFGSIYDNNYSEEKLKEIFNSCMKLECNYRISPDGIFYFCERQLIPSIYGNEENEKEIIHLENPNIDHELLKEKWDYVLKRPYLNACKYCGGVEKIEPAVQAKGILLYEDMK